MSSEREVYICEHCSTKLVYADLIFGKIPRNEHVFVAKDECMNVDVTQQYVSCSGCKKLVGETIVNWEGRAKDTVRFDLNCIAIQKKKEVIIAKKILK